MNKWIIQTSYGNGIAVAFEGSEKFVNESINFAVNRLTRNISRKADLVYVYTRRWKLYRALISEGVAFAIGKGLGGKEVFAAGKAHARNILNNAEKRSFMVELANYPKEKVFDHFSIDI